MSKRIVCLTCLSTFDLSGIKWADSRGAWADPRPVRNESTWSRWGRRLNGEAAAPEPSMAEVVEWEAQGYEPQCPLGHALPLEVARRDSIVIGLVGEVGSSKSHYLASLVTGLIEGDLLAKVGLDAGLAPESRQTFAVDYQNQLYGQQHKVLAATSVITSEEQAAARRPIIVVLRHAGTKREMNVIFYDASGEQLNSATAVAKYNRFLYAADALFFFVPPVTLPGIRGQIRTNEGFQQSLTQTKGMIDGLEVQLRGARGDLESRPIAASVLLCKADQCAGIDGFDDDLLLEPNYAAESIADTMARIRDESKKVYSFITQAGAANLVLGVESRFPGTTFHAVSATGCNPEDGVYPHLTPSRCADPMLSTLVRCGVISVEPGGAPALAWT